MQNCMFRKGLVSLVIILFIGIGIQPQFSIALPSNFEKLDLTSNSQNCYRTLITEFGDQKVIEINWSGNILWEYEMKRFSLPMDAERLENGNTLISDYGGGEVIEVNSAGDIVWQIDNLSRPMDAERLPNGNTLIAEGEVYPDGRVLEVDSVGNEVWNISKLDGPVDVERLEDGNTLIVEYLGDRIIEVDNSGNIVWGLYGLDRPMDVEKIDYGILITEYSGGRVSGGGWEITGLDGPIDAEPLDNGNLLIVELNGGRIIEVNSSGDIVWELTGFSAHDAERLNNPPSAPQIKGPRSRPLRAYKWTFKSFDPDGDKVSYRVSWGDGGTEDWFGPYPSGEEVARYHTYNDPGTYTIEAQAKDTYGALSNWSTMPVYISKSKEDCNCEVNDDNKLEKYKNQISKLQVYSQLLLFLSKNNPEVEVEYQELLDDIDLFKEIYDYLENGNTVNGRPICNMLKDFYWATLDSTIVYGELGYHYFYEMKYILSFITFGLAVIYFFIHIFIEFSYNLLLCGNFP